MLKVLLYADFSCPEQKREPCYRCSSGEVEDEYHFLFHCNKLENDRNLLLKEIAKSYTLIVTVEVSFQIRTPRDDAQGTVICRPPRVQSKKESHAYSCSLKYMSFEFKHLKL
jgi:hypothetical protein